MKPSNWASPPASCPVRPGRWSGRRWWFRPAGVEDAVRAEALLQAGSGAEHAAVDAHVFAQHQHRRVVAPAPWPGPAMASMRVIGVVVMLSSPRATAALSAALVCAPGAPFLISSMALLQGDRLGTLGQQVRRRIGIQKSNIASTGCTGVLRYRFTSSSTRVPHSATQAVSSSLHTPALIRYLRRRSIGSRCQASFTSASSR